MNHPRAVELALQTADALGALALRDLWLEIREVAGDTPFLAAEIKAHAMRPENRRLRAAIEAVCGEVSARKLGKVLARYEALSLCGIAVDAIGNEENSIVWRVKLTPDSRPEAIPGKLVELPLRG